MTHPTQEDPLKPSKRVWDGPTVAVIQALLSSVDTHPSGGELGI